MEKKIAIYTDGAYSRKLGKGGYSCIVYDEDNHIVRNAITGADEDKKNTNNRMEIKGLLAACKLATTKYKDYQVYIYCDSSYCVNMFNK